MVPTERLYSAMRRHDVTPGEVVDEDRIRRIAEETGGWTAVAGDILAGLKAGRRRIITGYGSTRLYWLSRLFPNHYGWFMDRFGY